MPNAAVSPKLLIALGISLIAASVAGCSNNAEQPPASTTTTTVNSAPPANTTTTTATAPASNANAPGTNNVNAGPGGATGTNAAVADAVNKAIHTNVQLTGSRITAVVDAAGVATLTGTAQNQQQKALAVRAATNTSGVTSVKDKIEIVPTGGAKAKTASTTKVIHETKVIMVPAPAGNPGAGGNANANGAGSGTGSAGNGSGNGNGAGSATSSTTNSGGNGTDTPANGNGQ